MSFTFNAVTPSKPLATEYQLATIIKLFNQAKETKDLEKSAGQLSIALLISARLNQKALFTEIHHELVQTLNGIPDDETVKTFKAWILGRVLSAASTINNPKVKEETSTQLDKILSQDLRTNEYHAWALGYAAQENPKQYVDSARQVADKLAATYQQKKTSRPLFSSKITDTKKKQEQIAQDKKELQADLSNVIWAYVLLAQAAIKNEDEILYKYAREKIKEITKFSHTKDAIEKCLLSTKLSTDFPTWAIAILSNTSALAFNPLDVRKTEQNRFRDYKETHNLLQKNLKVLIAQNPENIMLQAESVLSSLIAKEAESIVENKFNDPDVKEILLERTMAMVHPR